MRADPKWLAGILAAGALVASPPCHAGEDLSAAPPPDERFATFVPISDGRDHQLTYEAWTEVLSLFVVSMGPPIRIMPPGGYSGSRRNGHNSIYRLEGAMVGFSVMDDETIANIGRYRRELEQVADRIDIQTLPRNEQLAYWFNLHNVALVEKIAEVWPIYLTRDIMVDNVPLDEAHFITVEGVALSPRDIRENIVFRYWKDPKVIYGFWRGEIGGPAIRREAFDGRELDNQLERAAREFANSRRGVEKRGNTLHVSQLYAEVAPFFFPDFEADLRAHLGRYAQGDVAPMLVKTSLVKATLREHDIADLSGGRLRNRFYKGGPLSPAVLRLLAQRAQKFDYIQRKGLRTGTVIFSNIDLPGDPPNKGEVE